MVRPQGSARQRSATRRRDDERKHMVGAAMRHGATMTRRYIGPPSASLIAATVRGIARRQHGHRLNTQHELEAWSGVCSCISSSRSRRAEGALALIHGGSRPRDGTARAFAPGATSTWSAIPSRPSRLRVTNGSSPIALRAEGLPRTTPIARDHYQLRFWRERRAGHIGWPFGSSCWAGASSGALRPPGRRGHRARPDSALGPQSWTAREAEDTVAHSQGVAHTAVMQGPRRCAGFAPANPPLLASTSGAAGASVGRSGAAAVAVFSSTTGGPFVWPAWTWAPAANARRFREAIAAAAGSTPTGPQQPHTPARVLPSALTGCAAAGLEIPSGQTSTPWWRGRRGSARCADGSRPRPVRVGTAASCESARTDAKAERRHGHRHGRPARPSCAISRGRIAPLWHSCRARSGWAASGRCRLTAATRRRRRLPQLADARLCGTRIAPR